MTGEANTQAGHRGDRIEARRIAFTGTPWVLMAPRLHGTSQGFSSADASIAVIELPRPATLRVLAKVVPTPVHRIW